MVADVLALERGAGADFALEPGAAVDDGVVAQQRERDEDGGRGERGGAVESEDGDQGLYGDERHGEETPEGFGVFLSG